MRYEVPLHRYYPYSTRQRITNITPFKNTSSCAMCALVLSFFCSTRAETFRPKYRSKNIPVTNYIKKQKISTATLSCVSYKRIFVSQRQINVDQIYTLKLAYSNDGGFFL